MLSQLILLWFLSLLKSLPYRPFSAHVSWFLVPQLPSLSLCSYTNRISLQFFALACLSSYMHAFWEVREITSWTPNEFSWPEKFSPVFLPTVWSGSSDPQLIKSAVAVWWTFAERITWLTSFEDPTVFGIWKTTANKMCFCYLPWTELKCMVKRIVPYKVTKYSFAWLILKMQWWPSVVMMGVPSLGGHQCQSFILVLSQAISTENNAAVLAGCARQKCGYWFSGYLSAFESGNSDWQKRGLKADSEQSSD